MGGWRFQKPTVRQIRRANLDARSAPRRGERPYPAANQSLPFRQVSGPIARLCTSVVSVQWFGSDALELTYKTQRPGRWQRAALPHDEPAWRSSRRAAPGASTATAPVPAGLRGQPHPPGPPVRPCAGGPHLQRRAAASPDHGGLRVHAPRQPCGSCWRTIRAQARPSWQACSSRSSSPGAISSDASIVCPGSLAEQWQDELYRRFNLPFEILTNDKLEAARTGNWFLETNLVIARLDKLSRNEDVQAEAGWRPTADGI
jgi:hypothetical protein